jgi:hypothetical protein
MALQLADAEKSQFITTFLQCKVPILHHTREVLYNSTHAPTGPRLANLGVADVRSRASCSAVMQNELGVGQPPRARSAAVAIFRLESPRCLLLKLLLQTGRTAGMPYRPSRRKEPGNDRRAQAPARPRGSTGTSRTRRTWQWKATGMHWKPRGRCWQTVASASQPTAANKVS